FKGRNRPLHSLEGKNNVANIRWNADTGCVTWGKLALPVKLPTRDQDPYGHAALKSETKYCRYAKKPLSQRWHRLCGDDVIVQRDCYSAFLAKHATADGHSSRPGSKRAGQLRNRY
ncbi:MAG: hypothetical protein M0037_07865, partial [Betaproteobacteria bacterium]|nr:hypothetical protein [Betaproteobacteria bacterium]